MRERHKKLKKDREAARKCLRDLEREHVYERGKECACVRERSERAKGTESESP